MQKARKLKPKTRKNEIYFKKREKREWTFRSSSSLQLWIRHQKEKHDFSVYINGCFMKLSKYSDDDELSAYAVNVLGLVEWFPRPLSGMNVHCHVWWYFLSSLVIIINSTAYSTILLLYNGYRLIVCDSIVYTGERKIASGGQTRAFHHLVILILFDCCHTSPVMFKEKQQLIWQELLSFYIRFSLSSVTSRTFIGIYRDVWHFSHLDSDRSIIDAQCLFAVICIVTWINLEKKMSSNSGRTCF